MHADALAIIPFFHGECVNLTISQGGIQLLRLYLGVGVVHQNANLNENVSHK